MHSAVCKLRGAVALRRAAWNLTWKNVFSKMIDKRRRVPQEQPEKNLSCVA